MWRRGYPLRAEEARDSQQDPEPWRAVNAHDSLSVSPAMRASSWAERRRCANTFHDADGLLSLIRVSKTCIYIPPKKVFYRVEV